MITGGRSRYRPILLLAALGIVTAFLVSGCMWGVVKDANTGAGIAGATVKYTDSKAVTRSTTTNADGWYAFDQAVGAAPAAGPITIEVTAPGYNSVTAPRLVEYNDNAKADPANLSSFWEVQNFNLGTTLTADLAITDLYPDQGTLHSRITNNGPDSLTNASVQISCSYERTEWATGAKSTSGPVILPVTVSLNPGQTAPFGTTIALDTAKYWYDATCAVVVTFADPDPANNSYPEIIPNPGSDDDLRVTNITLTTLPASPNQVVVSVYAPPASSLGGFYKYELYANGTLVAQGTPSWPTGSTYFYTGYYVTGTETIRVVVDVGNKFPETDETNNEMTKTCDAATNSCGGGSIL